MKENIVREIPIFRKEDFNMTWKMLYMNRWPEDITITQQIGCVATQDGCEIAKLSNQSVDWQQLYWEKHLQKYAY